MSAAKVTRVVLVGSREISQAVVASNQSETLRGGVTNSAIFRSVLFMQQLDAYKEQMGDIATSALLVGIDIGLSMAEDLAKVRFEFLQTEAVKTVDAIGTVLEEYAQ